MSECVNFNFEMERRKVGRIGKCILKSEMIDSV